MGGESESICELFSRIFFEDKIFKLAGLVFIICMRVGDLEHKYLKFLAVGLILLNLLVFARPFYLGTPQFDLASSSIEPKLYEFDEEVGTLDFLYGETNIAVYAQNSERLYHISEELEVVWVRDLQDIENAVGLNITRGAHDGNSFDMLHVDAEGVWMYHYSIEQEFHNIYQIGSSSVQIWELDTFEVEYVASLQGMAIDTRFVDINNQLTVLIESFVFYFQTPVESKENTDIRNLAIYELQSDGIELLLWKEDTSYGKIKDIIIDDSTPIMEFLVPAPDNEIRVEMYRFEDNQLTKDHELTAIVSTINEAINGSKYWDRKYTYFRGDALITVWESEIPSPENPTQDGQLLLHFFTDDIYFGEVDLSNQITWTRHGYPSSSPVQIGGVDNFVVADYYMSTDARVKNSAVQIILSGYTIEQRELVFPIEEFFFLFGIAQINQAIFYYGWVWSPTQDPIDVLVRSDIEPANLAGEIASYEPIELYGIMNITYTMVILGIYLYKRKTKKTTIVETFPEWKENQL